MPSLPNIRPPPSHWLSAERVRLYALPMLAAALCMLWLAVAVDAHGRRIAWLPIGDFIAYWSAASLGLQGEPLAAYDLRRLTMVEQDALPGFAYAVSWHYPPTFLLLLSPLALLPLSAAWLVFMAFGFALYLWVILRSLAALRAVWSIVLLVLAFPGTAANIVFGQNAFLTAALMGGGLLLLQRHAILAGVCFGLLSVKPHQALLLPLALACGGHWRSLATAALTAAALLLLAMACFGEATLPAFFEGMLQARHWMEAAGRSSTLQFAGVDPGRIDLRWLTHGFLDRSQMPTLFAFARELGAPLTLAYGLQIAQAVMVALVVAMAWRSAMAWPLRCALLMLGSLLATPYLFDYELAWLLMPIAWCAAHGLQQGWRGFERELLLAAYVAPLPLMILSAVSGLPWLQFLFLALFASLAWRERATLMTGT